MADDTPHIFVEPPIPLATEFSSVDQVRAVITQLDQGNFRMPSLLLERMMWNPRLRATTETRLAGLISTEVRFEPARNTPDCRRAAKELTEDWRYIATSPMRKQMWQAALFLGFGLAQRVEDVAPTGRTIFKLRPYWPGFASWYWARKAYRVITFDAGVTETASPSVDRKAIDVFAPSPSDRVPSASEQPWVIAEPFGVNSYRGGLIHAAWRPWLGHEWASRDQARASEKHGLGIVKFYYPAGKGTEYEAGLKRSMAGLRTMGAEGVIPLERRPDDIDGKNVGFDVEPFEFNGAGFQAISDTMNANAVALAILLLGHNLTTEIKGGGSYAAAGVADYIRDDKKFEDGDGEYSYAGPQLIVPWAEANYGDPSLAPIAHYVTDSPAVNLQRAQMIYQVSMAAAQLRANVPKVDCDALAEEFRLPMLSDGVTVQVPAQIDAAAGDAAPDEQASAVDGVGASKADATLALTPSDLASIVKVDEGRESIGLKGIGGDTGGLWIREHGARLAATLPVDPVDEPAPPTPEKENE
jgi:hypothetical protein